MALSQPVRRHDNTQAPVRRPHFDITAETLWFRMREAARRDTVDFRDLSELAQMHPDVREVILRAANESERSPIRPFDDVTRAMVFLGLQRIRSILSEQAETPADSARESVSKLNVQS